MANQLGKFFSWLTKISQPLCELLSPKQSWQWKQAQKQAFAKGKAELIVLNLYDLNASIKISADASSFGLRAVFFQKSNDIWKPVAYAFCFHDRDWETLCTDWGGGWTECFLSPHKFWWLLTFLGVKPSLHTRVLVHQLLRLCLLIPCDSVHFVFYHKVEGVYISSLIWCSSPRIPSPVKTSENVFCISCFNSTK